MNKLYTLIFLALTTLSTPIIGTAQNDTLFYENFNEWAVREADSIFISYDSDQIADANGLPGSWFTSNLANGGADSLERCVLSSSWLAGSVNGNRNALILPGVYLPDSTTSLSWRSSPALGSLYMDGYTVAISTDSLYYYYFSFLTSGNNFADGDTLMHFAQNTGNDENQFSEGVQHTNFDINAGISPTGVMQYPGLFSPWSVDLSAYAGQKVYIGFFHDSDDDNYIAIDDILLTGTFGTEPVDTPVQTTSVQKLAPNLNFNLFPNPANNKITIESNQQINDLKIYSSIGSLVYQQQNITTTSTTIDLSVLPIGFYSVIATGNATQTVKSFIKQ